MVISYEKKREINNEIAKFLQHLITEEKERLDAIDVIDIKDFDLNLGLNMYPSQANIATRTA